MTFYLTYVKTRIGDDYFRKTFRFLNINNAYLNAELLSECEDVSGSVDTIDSETGEVLFVFENGKLTYRSPCVAIEKEEK